MKIHATKGITPIEVLVVVATVLFIQGMIAAGYFGAKQYLAHERDIVRINDINRISAAVKTYYQQYGSMPQNRAQGRGYCQNEQDFLRELVDAHILSSIPVDPSYPKRTYCYYDYGFGSKYGGYVTSTLETIKEPEGHCAWKDGNNWCMPNSNSYCQCNTYGVPTPTPMLFEYTPSRGFNE